MVASWRSTPLALPCHLDTQVTCWPPTPPLTVLANGAGGTRELAAVLLAKLPAGVWKVLPVRWGGCDWGRVAGALHLLPVYGICFGSSTTTGCWLLRLPSCRVFPGAPPQPPQPHAPCACRSAAVKIKSWATHRVELPELAVPLELSALRPTPGHTPTHHNKL